MVQDVYSAIDWDTVHGELGAGRPGHPGDKKGSRVWSEVEAGMEGSERQALLFANSLVARGKSAQVASSETPLPAVHPKSGAEGGESRAKA